MTPPLVVAIPVKRLNRAKSRLATVLDDGERRDLTLRLFSRTLAVVRDAGVAARIVVISSDLDVLTVAESGGAVPLHEVGVGYNRALEQTRQYVADNHRDATFLALAADLPLLEPNDVAALAMLASAERAVVVAPDLREVGTNAIGFRLSEPVRFRFGIESFRRHVSESEQHGLSVHVYRAAGTAFDLDLPFDLEELERLPAESRYSISTHLARSATSGYVRERDGDRGGGIAQWQAR